MAPVAIQQRHRGDGRGAVGADVGEQVRVIELVGGGVGDRDQAAVPRRLRAWQVGVEGRQRMGVADDGAAVRRRGAQQRALDERQRGVVGVDDGRGVAGDELDHVGAVAARREHSAELGQPDGPGAVVLEAHAEGRCVALRAPQPVQRDGERDADEHGTDGDGDRRPRVGPRRVVGADHQGPPADVDTLAAAPPSRVPTIRSPWS